ncbi:MAG: NAD(P)/FAD-dependent oxidoreductase [Firmicutes bacterium]|nr:NAD(P)/FAD-dependent oxidoreductase [Bacillota bacterium]
MMRIVVVGLGAAGLAAVEEARKTAPAARITAISNEPHPAYYRPQLSHRLVTGADPQSLLIRKPEWYAQNRVELRLGTAVIRLLVDEKRVELAGGESAAYDACVLAMGSSSFLPPVRGRELRGVFTLRNITDALGVRETLSSATKPVIIGGGPLGLEAAWAIASAGKGVTVLERGDRLLKRQIDEEGSRFLHDLLGRAGISVVYGADTGEITGAGRVEGVSLKDSRVIEADFVLFSAGVRPNTAVAKAAGLQVQGGVVVDDRMRTSAGSVYAAGDVAEWDGRVAGVMPVAVAQGKVAGANAAGGDITYVEPELSVVINILGFSIASVGEVGGGDFALGDPPAKDEYLKVFFKGETPVGAVSIGEARRVSALRQIVARGAGVTGARQLNSASEMLRIWSSSK